MRVEERKRHLGRIYYLKCGFKPLLLLYPKRSGLSVVQECRAALSGRRELVGER